MIGIAVLLPGPLVLNRVVGVLRERGELIRMVQDVCDDDLAVLPRGFRIAEDLHHVVLVHGDGVAAWHPLV